MNMLDAQLSDRKLLSTYLRPQWRRVALLAVLQLAGIGLMLINPQIVRFFIDNALAGTGGLLAGAALLFIVAAFALQGVTLLTNYVGEAIAWRSTNALRADLALHCLRLDLPFHKAHAPGELIERIDGDVSTLGTFLSRFGVDVASNLLLLAGTVVVLYLEDWRIGLGVTAYALAAILLLWRLQNAGVKRWAASRQADAEHYSFLEERLLGTEDIRSSGAEQHIVERLRSLTLAMMRRFRSAMLLSNLTRLAMGSLHAFGYALGLGLGAWLFSQGQITIGTAYLIVNYIALLAGPLENLRYSIMTLQEASANIGRIGEMFAHQPAVRDEAATRLPSGPLAAQFEGITFRYDDDNLALDGVSFTVAPGEVIGVLGRTGSGKSTLTRLLFRLYDPLAGSICLGGTDLRQVGLSDLRDRIALVTQDVQLFEATIRDNVTLFNRRISDAQIEHALVALGLWEWVQAREGGLDGKLAPGGHGLSAGEAQLLAFARAFLKDPGLVVLDEASSRLDPATEQLLERAVDQLLQGRTGVVIAHRLRTVQRADTIVIFEHGKVVEIGPREALAQDPNSRFSQLLRVGLDLALESDAGTEMSDFSKKSDILTTEEVSNEHVAV
jgi:ATP-binding cassette, subfamily B, bacterial